MSDNMVTFLASLSPDVRAIVGALRYVIRQTVPDVEETLLWGGISYHSPWIGGRVKGALCQIEAKGSEVRISFVHGIRLADPNRLLRGTALSKRFVRIHTVDEAQQSEIAALIREASAIELEPPA